MRRSDSLTLRSEALGRVIEYYLRELWFEPFSVECIWLSASAFFRVNGIFLSHQTIIRSNEEITSEELLSRCVANRHGLEKLLGPLKAIQFEQLMMEGGPALYELEILAAPPIH